MDIEAELDAFLSEQWRDFLTVREWWERLGTNGWAAPFLPSDCCGRGLSPKESSLAAGILEASGVVPAPRGIGLGLAAPTIVAHGSKEQKDRYLPGIVTGATAWCQLYSEPGAGSDLAGITTSAVLDGEHWVINGQKVWTSDAAFADFGILLARTNFDVPKHQGISYFILDMNQPGVAVRPLREMTGLALFNEVFFTDARIPLSDMIGTEGEGWSISKTTLAVERAAQGVGTAMGAGLGGGKLLTPPAGRKGGALDLLVTEFLPDRPRATRGRARGAGPPSPTGAGAHGRVTNELLIERARSAGRASDPLVRQDLAELVMLERVGQLTAARGFDEADAGKPSKGAAILNKLALNRLARLHRDVTCRIAGVQAMLHAYEPEDQGVLEHATTTPGLAAMTHSILMASVPSIAGGTDEIQHNIVGERILGLPAEPRTDVDVPFREVPRNG